MSRRPIVVTALSAVALLAVPETLHIPLAFLWNASASVPIGLYRLTSAKPLELGDLVVVAPPAQFADLLDNRGYLPRGVPLIKQVAALAGSTVCRSGVAITIDSRAVGTALDRDSHDRSLPVWQGCRLLAEGDVFLMNSNAADSFDGRYFGPLPVSTIVARALPVWTDVNHDGRFHWHIAGPTGAR